MSLTKSVLISLVSIIALSSVVTATTDDLSIPEAPVISEEKVQSEEETLTLTASSESNWIYRGFGLDKNMNVIISNNGERRHITEKYGTSLANVLDPYTSSLAIDSQFEDILRHPNPTTIYTRNGNKLGQSAVYTLDAELHNDIYNYLQNENLKGSVTVIDGCGKVLVLASYPSFDANAEDHGQLNLEPHSCLNRTVEPAKPGSAFKILSGIVAVHQNFGPYEDRGIENYDISNWDSKEGPYPQPVIIYVREALKRSSNCYFARLFYETGAEKVLAILSKYFLFDQDIKTDFITISNSMKTDTNSDLARCGFGQRCNISPLYLAMISSAVVTGKMYRPFILDRTVDSVTMETIQTYGVPEVISEIPPELTEQVKLGLTDVASDLILTYAGKIVYAKTGTAELSDVQDIHYIVATVAEPDSCSPETTKSIVFQCFNSTEKYASGDARHVRKILDMISKSDERSNVE